MQKPTFLKLSIFISGLAAMSLAGAIFVSSAQAQQPSGSSAAQGSTSTTQQATPPASTPNPQAPVAPKKTPAAKPGSSAAKKTTPAPLTLKTENDKISYAIGMNIGKRLDQDRKQLQQNDTELNTAILLRAIKDALAGEKLLMTDQEAQTTLTTLQTDLRDKQKVKQDQLSAANKKEGEEFLATNKAKAGVVTLPDGLQYKVLQEGTGPKPASTDMVTVNYRGTLLNGTEFDSSYKRGQPATFGVTGVIKGWTEALELMPVGSKWQLFIPSDLAYGPPGRAPMIGPNSTLVFDVELVSIQPRTPPAPAPIPGGAVQPSLATAPGSAPPPPTPAPTSNPAPNAPQKPPATAPPSAPTPKPPTP